MDAVISQEVLRPVLGPNVARLRKMRKLTQEEFAKRLGISEQHVNRIEKGKASPGAELLFSMADILNVATDKFRQVPVDES